MLTINDMYDLSHTLAADYLSGFTYPWEALSGIKELIISLGEKLDKNEYDSHCDCCVSADYEETCDLSA